MRKRYEAAPARHAAGALDWLVRETDAAGSTAWIKCFCYGEAAAKEIARALNVLEAIGNTLDGSDM